MLLAYVIATPEHYQYMLEKKDSLFPDVANHLLDVKVRDVASLMLYACIAPEDGVNDEVSAVIKQCDDKRGWQKNKDNVSVTDVLCSGGLEQCDGHVLGRYSVPDHLSRVVLGKQLTVSGMMFQ